MRFAALLLTLILAMTARGDSGLVRFQVDAGPWTITMMSDPTPLRAGPVDLSVLVQQDDGAAVLDADVTLRLAHEGIHLDVPATRAQADNQLLYAAKFRIPESGAWHVAVVIDHDGIRARHATEFTVLPPAPRLAKLWPWLLPVPLGLAFYAVNQSVRSTRP